MTIPIEVMEEEEIEEANNTEDTVIQETIDFMMAQPVETLEMLQKSFLTYPNIATGYVHKNASSILPSSIPFNTIGTKVTTTDKAYNTSEGIQEIQLQDGITKGSVLLLNNDNDERIPLPKVDNFVDDVRDEDNDFIDLLHQHLPSSNNQSHLNELSQNSRAEDKSFETSNSISLCSFIAAGSAKFEVKMLNIITKDAVLPGQPKEDWSPPQHLKEKQTNDSEDVDERCLDVIHDTLTNGNGACNDQVVAFKLDDMYDYENVKITPRFQTNENKL